MVTMLQIRVALTLIAWLLVLLIVAHGKYVTEKIAAGEYDKGPVTGTTTDERHRRWEYRTNRPRP